MSTRRCSQCAADWPNNVDYATCPECREPTDFLANKNAMPDDVAVSRKRKAQFGDYLKIWEDARAGDPDAIKWLRRTGAAPPPVGPPPEEEGAQEARELIEDFWAEVDQLASTT